jgi:hypothetical protein
VQLTALGKGRVERAHLTLQDRLVKELRLRGIQTMEAANTYALSFMATYNAHFAKPPRSVFNAHRPLRDDEDLDAILTWRVLRKVSDSLTVLNDRVIYLLEETEASRKLIGRYIDVWEYPDGRMEIRANGVALRYVQYDKLSEIDQGAVIEHKRLGHTLRVAQALQALRDNRRVSGSPSRTNRGTEVRSKERAPGTKKQREFTLDDLNAAVSATCCTPAGPVPAPDSRQPPADPQAPSRRPAVDNRHARHTPA